MLLLHCYWLKDNRKHFQVFIWFTIDSTAYGWPIFLRDIWSKKYFRYFWLVTVWNRLKHFGKIKTGHSKILKLQGSKWSNPYPNCAQRIWLNEVHFFLSIGRRIIWTKVVMKSIEQTKNRIVINVKRRLGCCCC